MRGRDGTIIQSISDINANDYVYERMFAPVVGIVLNVRPADDPINRSAVDKHDQRGTHLEAQVLVVNDGLDSPWIIPNAIILPSGVSGFDNYHEEVPRAASQLVDGTKFDLNMADVDYDKIDGDWCVVQFIGGIIEQAIITHWFPHPGNKTDPATGSLAGETDPVTGSLIGRTLLQGPRIFKRYNGIKYTITNKGNIFLDTNEGGSVVIGSDGKPIRVLSEEGGNMQVDMRKEASLEVNFNPPKPQPIAEPSLPQPNTKNSPKIDEPRDDLLSRFLMNEDFINAVAGRVVQIMGNNDGTGKNDTVLLGETPTDHVVLGEAFQGGTFQTLVDRINAFQGAFEQHIHGTPSGNTTAPINITTPESSYANPCFPILNVPPATAIYAACNLPAAGPLTGDLGGPEFIIDAAQAAQATAATGTPVTLPPPAPGVTRVDPMPDEDLSDVVKTE